jgi:hypothetical protein
MVWSSKTVPGLLAAKGRNKKRNNNNLLAPVDYRQLAAGTVSDTHSCRGPDYFSIYQRTNAILLQYQRELAITSTLPYVQKKQERARALKFSKGM